jgi:hypothetical protein
MMTPADGQKSTAASDVIHSRAYTDKPYMLLLLYGKQVKWQMHNWHNIRAHVIGATSGAVDSLWPHLGGTPLL